MNDLVLAQATGPGPSPFGPILVMALIFGFFYFLVIRPQQRREREKGKMRDELKRGDEIITVGGLYGRVADLKGSVVVVELASNVRVRMERRAIEGLASPKKDKEKDD